ncbi:hypothetical protein VDIAB_100095 [Vibrio diabolicus]|nr:hypothetical protein VDIAB_100095 [Vibrio diabolicus]
MHPNVGSSNQQENYRLNPHDTILSVLPVLCGYFLFNLPLNSSLNA